MNFIKWLGVRVPKEAEEAILTADKPVDKSVEFLCDVLRKILAECVGVGVPLGISCESVSIFKSEIDGCHELFRRLQEILLDTRGSPWKVSWVEVMPPAGIDVKAEEGRRSDEKAIVSLRCWTRICTCRCWLGWRGCWRLYGILGRIVGRCKEEQVKDERWSGTLQECLLHIVLACRIITSNRYSSEAVLDLLDMLVL